MDITAHAWLATMELTVKLVKFIIVLTGAIIYVAIKISMNVSHFPAVMEQHVWIMLIHITVSACLATITHIAKMVDLIRFDHFQKYQPNYFRNK